MMQERGLGVDPTTDLSLGSNGMPPINPENQWNSPRVAQRDAAHQYCGLREGFMEPLLFSSCTISDPLSKTNRTSKAACEAFSAKRASRCATRGCCTSKNKLWDQNIWMWLVHSTIWR